MIKILISNMEEIIRNKEFLNLLKVKLSKGKLLFVPSNLKNKKLTEEFGTEIYKLFLKNNLLFVDIEYLYEDFDFKLLNSMNEYSLIFLMGGDTVEQNSFITKINLMKS
ncbi:hypothetical protein [Miniphocaeibacter halophilus]|uniref:Uncharacterized protein n=1 Tax=Miniphocaeibacter halophilus TaxID=2931922 RepID=A0AC61MSG2_9FIRM|nr:hypothetical protein [Miniphocaeibacter halophilus]QQK07769.1 hypothetical protein JFY71_10865 [Miniphocaeibacter halophilus]